MKKLLTFLAICVALNAFSQNTTILPNGTSSSNITVRTTGTDSLHTSWINFPGIGWNQFYSATESNLKYLRFRDTASMLSTYANANRPVIFKNNTTFAFLPYSTASHGWDNLIGSRDHLLSNTGLSSATPIYRNFLFVGPPSASVGSYLEFAVAHSSYYAYESTTSKVEITLRSENYSGTDVYELPLTEVTPGTWYNVTAKYLTSTPHNFAVDVKYSTASGGSYTFRLRRLTATSDRAIVYIEGNFLTSLDASANSGSDTSTLDVYPYNSLNGYALNSNASFTGYSTFNFTRGTSLDSVGYGAAVGSNFVANETHYGASQFINPYGSTLIKNTFTTPVLNSTMWLRNNVLTIWNAGTPTVGYNPPSTIGVLNNQGYQTGSIGWSGIDADTTSAYFNSMIFTATQPYFDGVFNDPAYYEHTPPKRLVLGQEGKAPDSNTFIISDRISLESNWDIVFRNARRAVSLNIDGTTGISTFSKEVNFNSKVASQGVVDNGNYSVFQGYNNSVVGTPTVSYDFSNNGTVKSSIKSAVYGNDYMAFNVGTNTERMRITADGSIGFGTPNPLGKYHFMGKTNQETGGQVIISDNGIYDPTINFYRWTGTGRTYRAFQLRGDGNNNFYISNSNLSADNIGTETLINRFVIDYNGNVGIGTDTPGLINGVSSKILEVAGSVNPALSLRNTTTGQQFASYVDIDGYHIFDSNRGVDAFTINPVSGFVGINYRVNPDNGYKLGVNGDVYINGRLYTAAGMSLGASSNGFVQYNTIDQITNYERIRSSWTGNIFVIAAENGGTGVQRNININTPLLTINGNLAVTSFNSTATQTTANGSTSGTAIFSQPFQGSSYKKVVISLNAINGSVTYNFPVAFTSLPSIFLPNGSTTAVFSSLSLSQGSVTLTTTSELTLNLTIEGY